MDNSTLFRLIGVALFLTFLLILAYYIARKGKVSGLYNNKRQAQRIQVIETRMIDTKRQLSLVSVDRKEYLILTSPTGETLTLHRLLEETPANYSPAMGAQQNIFNSPGLNMPPPLGPHFRMD